MSLLVEKPNNMQLMMKGTTDRMMSVLRPNTSESQPPKMQPPTFAKAQIDAEIVNVFSLTLFLSILRIQEASSNVILMRRSTSSWSSATSKLLQAMNPAMVTPLQKPQQKVDTHWKNV